MTTDTTRSEPVFTPLPEQLMLSPMALPSAAAGALIDPAAGTAAADP